MKRPAIIIILLVFLTFATLMAWVAGFSLFCPGTFIDGIWKMNPEAYDGFASMGKTAPLLLAILGLCTLSAAIGTLLRRKWAWWLTVSIFVLNIIGDLTDMFIHGDIVKRGLGILIVLVSLFFLTRPVVKRYF